MARRRRSWGQWVVLLLFLAVLVCGLGVAFVHRSTLFPQPESEPAGLVNLYPQLNCRFVVPDKPWLPENRVKQSLNALVALHRSNPDSWFALVARDYKDRTPPETEVRAEGIGRLKDYFIDSLEHEPRGPVQVAGQPAQQEVFRGENEDGSVTGECIMLAHQGIAYWLIWWTSSEQTTYPEDELGELRRRFALLEEREDWSEKRVTQTYRGRRAACLLRDSEGVWQEWTPATDYDPRADLALVARERSEPTDGKDKRDDSYMVAATLLVLILNQADAKLPAAVEAARAHVEMQQKLIYPETTIAPVADKALTPGEAVAVGQARGHVAKLLVKNGATRQRFVLLGVVPQPGHLVVIQCECDWKRRGLWESDFLRMIGTFQVTTEPVE